MKRKKVSAKITIIGVILLLCCLIIAGCSKQEAAYPNRRIQGFIAAGAGGATDLTSRAIAANVDLGGYLIMDNMGGGAGTIAYQHVMSQPADGYTLYFFSEAPGLWRILDIQEEDLMDTETIILFGACPTVIVVPKNSPFNSYEDLVNYAKDNPGKLNVGTSGLNGGPFLAFSIVEQVEDIEVNYIHYDGEGPMLGDLLMGEELHASALTVPVTKDYLESDNIKAFAVMAKDRVEVISDVPAISEIKAEYEDHLQYYGCYYGLAVHKDTPKEVIGILIDEFSKAYNSKEYQDFLVGNGFVPLGLTGEEAKQYCEEWRSRMAWLFYESGAVDTNPLDVGIPKLE